MSPEIATEPTFVDTSKQTGIAGSGYLVPTGQPIPAANEAPIPYRENSPNTADAASNDPDAADKAHAGARPSERVVGSFGSPEHGQAAPAKGATREEWNAHATALGIDPAEYSSKEDLIAAVEARGNA